MVYPDRSVNYVLIERFNIDQLPGDTMALNELMEDLIHGWGYAAVLLAVSKASTAKYYSGEREFVSPRLKKLVQEIEAQFPDDRRKSLVSANTSNMISAWGGGEAEAEAPSLKTLRLGRYN